MYCSVKNLIYLIYFDHSTENYVQLSNESIQNLSSVYNGTDAIVNSMKVNNIAPISPATNVAVNGDVTVSGKIISGPLQVSGYLWSNDLGVTGEISSTGNLIVGGALCGIKNNERLCTQQDGLYNMIRYYQLKDIMYDGNAIIYDTNNNGGINNALTTGVIAKLGTPSGWSEEYRTTKLWGGSNMFRMSHSSVGSANGITVTVPTGISTQTSPTQLDSSFVIWIKVCNERWNTVNLYRDSDAALIGQFTTGQRKLCQINPNGSEPDDKHSIFVWMPMAIPYTAGTNKIRICSGVKLTDTWIAGIAFSKNPWNHAMNSALGYYWAQTNNSGTASANVNWNSDNWNGDQLAEISVNATIPSKLMIPVIPSGRDKLVYIIEHNDAWQGSQHVKLTVGGIQIENFKSSYTNPFTTHYNSKFYCRYIAARIPSSLILPTQSHIELVITPTSDKIHFREAGTHDYL